jgi:DNA-binding NarL/FixJ family response regulator
VSALSAALLSAIQEITEIRANLQMVLTLIDGGAARAEMPNAVPNTAGITEREHQLLVLLGMGLSNKQIAERAGITENTVKGAMARIFQKLGVFNRTQAAILAHDLSLTKEKL